MSSAPKDPEPRAGAVDERRAVRPGLEVDPPVDPRAVDCDVLALHRHIARDREGRRAERGSDEDRAGRQLLDRLLETGGVDGRRHRDDVRHRVGDTQPPMPPVDEERVGSQRMCAERVGLKTRPAATRQRERRTSVDREHALGRFRNVHEERDLSHLVGVGQADRHALTDGREMQPRRVDLVCAPPVRQRRPGTSSTLYLRSARQGLGCVGGLQADRRLARVRDTEAHERDEPTSQEREPLQAARGAYVVGR